MKTAHALAALIAATAAITPDLARACSDAGPSNPTNDGGAAWIACERHDDCPSDQRCGAGGWCFSGTSCSEELCDDTGCRCCAHLEPASSCGPPRFVCDPSDLDAGASADAAQSGIDGGPRAPEPRSSSCSAGAHRGGEAAWLPVLALGLAIARRRRAR